MATPPATREQPHAGGGQTHGPGVDGSTVHGWLQCLRAATVTMRPNPSSRYHIVIWGVNFHVYLFQHPHFIYANMHKGPFTNVLTPTTMAKVPNLHIR